MKLNHDIYKGAMDSVRLSDETGLKLLEQAAQQSRQHRHRRVQAAAVMAVCLIAALSLNGICYAQTGKNALEMFASFFREPNVDAIAELAEGARESGESIIHENLKFTLERYWYDQENMEVFYTIRTETLDGSPIDEEEIEEKYLISLDCDGGSNWRGQAGDTGENFYVNYYFADVAYEKYGKPVEQMRLKVEFSNGYTPPIGFFELEPTGKMKTRYADLSFLEGCSQKASITGSGVKMMFDENWIMDSTAEKNRPFERLDVVMKDGTIFRGGSSKGRSRDVLPVYNAEGELLNAAELAAAPREEDIRECDETLMSTGTEDGQDGLVYRISFPEFVDVDDIEGVYMDHVKLPLE